MHGKLRKTKVTKKMRKKIKKLFFKISFISVFILSLGAIMSKINNNPEEGIASIASTNPIEAKDLKEITYEELFPHNAKINELKKLGNISDQDINEMLASIKEYLGDDITSTSISYYDIITGRNFNINEKVELKAASTVKVPVSMMLYEAINNGELSEKDTMTFKQGDYEASFGGIGYENLNEPKTFEHINESMIMYSDNVAVNMLLRFFGNDKRYDFIESIVNHKINRNGNYSTAEDTMKILKTLYLNPNNNPFYEKIIKLMKNTSFHERLDKFVPKEIVAHKIGDYGDNTGSYVHDVGIIYTKQPYILVVMTKNLSDSYNKIANVSKIIYDIQTQ
ncbi:serine hydrolase [Clostridium sp.]|uniref:serine hydrolase n=1 Tax=Clostridium sp. TaxID=1506 RepID=UPI002FCC4D52